MVEPVADIPATQDANKQKEQPEDNPNQATTLAIMDSSEYQTPPAKESPNVSRWLGASISKKQNVVPINVPIEDMVSRCLRKMSKSKRLKVEAMLEVDENTGHWVAEMAKPISDKDPENATKKDFSIEKIDLGTASRATDTKHLESSNKRMLSRTWKDEKDKRELKQVVKQMAEYINAIHHPSPQPLSQVSQSFDPKSPMNQNLLDKVQRNRMMVVTFDEWLESIIQ